MKLDRRIVILATVLGAAACATPAAVAPPAQEASIERAAEAWLAAWERGDAAGVAALFEEDGIYAANTGQLLEGRDAIREGVAGWVAMRPPGARLDLQRTPVRTRFDGNSVHDLSRFLIRLEPAGCIVDAGYALAVWRPDAGGEWRIAMLTVNQDPQPPPGACPR